MALIMLVNDLCCAWDGSSTSILVLLDLSSAFNTIGCSHLCGAAQGTGSERHSVNVVFSPLFSWCWWAGEDWAWCPCFVMFIRALTISGFCLQSTWSCRHRVILCHTDDTKSYVSAPDWSSDAVKVLPQCSGSMGDVWARIGFSSTLARSSSYSLAP